jgi:ligand-binding sensor domain-containing protein
MFRGFISYIFGLLVFVIFFFSFTTMTLADARLKDGMVVLANPGPIATLVENVNDISFKNIRKITQGKDGFLWLATGSGLLRFDGVNVKQYGKKESGTNSLPHDLILDLAQDQQGYIWLSTKGGLSRFNPATEYFDNFYHNPDDVTSLSSNRLSEIQIVADHIWIASENGMNLFNRKTLKNQRLSVQLTAYDEDKPQNIHQVYQDSQQRLWISHKRHGVVMHSADRQTVSYFNTDDTDPNSLGESMRHIIYEAHNGQIWIGGRATVNKFDASNNNFTRLIIPYRSVANSVSAKVRGLFEDANNRLYISTLNNGLNIVTDDERSVVNVNEDYAVLNSLNHNAITNCFRDRNDIVWCNGFGKGD